MQVVNASNLPQSVINKAVLEVASAFDSWQTRPEHSPLSMFMRGKFTQPTNRAEQIAAIELAVKDDLVSGALDTQEGLILSGLSWESSDPATSLLMNKVAEDIDLDAVFRRMSREILKHGMFTAANWWTAKTHQIKTPDVNGKPRNKQVNAFAPERISILDISKVVWMSTGPWNTKRMFWQHEDDDIDMDEESANRLFAGRYEPNVQEEIELRKAGATDMTNLFLLRNTAWSHTNTIPDYMLYPESPLAGLPALLEVRARLFDSDRAALVGAANYILVIKVGDETLPADDDEIDAAWEGVKQLAKIPVIVGQHRLQVEILAPPIDSTLSTDKHNAINAAIYCATFGLPPAHMFKDIDPEILGNFVRARLSSHRRQLARALERNIAKAMVDASPRLNLDRASLVFTPREIPVYGVNNAVESILAARQRSEISRETYLDMLNLDQDTEAQRMRHEEESGLNDIFLTHEPFDSPNGVQNNPGGPSARAGASGGRPSGTKDSTTRQAKGRA